MSSLTQKLERERKGKGMERKGDGKGKEKGWSRKVEVKETESRVRGGRKRGLRK